MRIIKEVKICADAREIWSWLTEPKKLRSTSDSHGNWRNDNRRGGRRNAGAKFPIAGGRWKVLEMEPPRKLTLSIGTRSVPLSATYELFPKGRRTRLKLTISGWENIDPEKARLEMPAVSLEWEKKLRWIKQAIESAVKEKQLAT